MPTRGLAAGYDSDERVLTAGQGGTTGERRCRILVADGEDLIRRLLVRTLETRLRAAARTGPGTFACGRLSLDIVHQQADAGAGPVPLTSREFQLLFELMRRPGTVVQKDDLITRLWGTPPDTTSNVVDVYVRRLRSRLGADVITTVRGAGYRISS